MQQRDMHLFNRPHGSPGQQDLWLQAAVSLDGQQEGMTRHLGSDRRSGIGCELGRQTPWPPEVQRRGRGKGLCTNQATGWSSGSGQGVGRLGGIFRKPVIKVASSCPAVAFIACSPPQSPR